MPTGLSSGSSPEASIFIEDTPPASGLTLVGVRVLVVEDDDDARELLKVVLEICGATVATATGARDGLRQFYQLRPDVLVSDLAMPDENGCWLAQQVRAAASPGGRRLGVVAVTANTDERIHQICLESGFDVVLTKPVDPARLCTVVQRLARTR